MKREWEISTTSDPKQSRKALRSDRTKKLESSKKNSFSRPANPKLRKRKKTLSLTQITKTSRNHRGRKKSFPLNLLSLKFLFSK